MSSRPTIVTATGRFQRLRSLWVSPSLGNPIYFAGVIDVCLNEALQGTKIPDNMLLHEQLNRGIVPGFRTELPIAPSEVYSNWFLRER